LIIRPIDKINVMANKQLKILVFFLIHVIIITFPLMMDFG